MLYIDFYFYPVVVIEILLDVSGFWFPYPVVDIFNFRIFPEVEYSFMLFYIMIGGLFFSAIGNIWNLLVLVFIFHSFSNLLILAISCFFS